MAARMALADMPLAHCLAEPLIPYEDDEVTRLIVDSHDAQAFAALASLTVGEFRDWLLRHDTDTATLARVAPGVTPEMAAAVSKLMRNQDLVAVARKCAVVTAFRNTIGLPGRLAVRLQPNHPTDDPRGIAASIVDGLLYGCGDATIGINPASDNLGAITTLLKLLDDIRTRYEIPTQSCVLTHVTNTLRVMEQGAPVDLVFQSVAGSQAANAAFGISLALLEEARQAALSLRRGTVGHNVMYFETGQGSALSPTPTMAWISRPWRRAPMRWRAGSSRCWSIPWWGSSVPSISTTASRSSGPGWRTISAASCWACRWAATSATRTTPRPIRTTWTTC
jgi:ethanolamine ammonia-lyase large subunit